MGSRLVEGNVPHELESEGNNDLTFISSTKYMSDCFFNVFASYLSIGMTYDQFWNDDCTLVKYYRESHKLKMKQKNQDAHLLGRYVYDALCLVSPILRAFSKAQSPLPYMKEPYPITHEDVELFQQQKERASYDRIKHQLMSLARKDGINE